MGILDNIKLEKVLATKVDPSAFGPSYPSSASPANLVIHDMNAVVCSGIMSAETTELGQAVKRAKFPIDDIYGGGYGESNIRCDDRVKLVYAVDDPRFLPKLREMQHEKRYGSLEGLTNDDIGDVVFSDDALLPGSRPGEETSVRKRAYKNERARFLWNAYIRWKLVVDVLSGVSTGQRCEKCQAFLNTPLNALWEGTFYCVDTSPQEAESDVTRCVCDKHLRGPTLIVENVPCNLGRALRRGHGGDGDAEPSPVIGRAYADISERDIASLKRSERVVSVDLRRRAVVSASKRPLRIGESDLKMVHYALRETSEGDTVLVRNMDSDVLWILLLNMPRLHNRHIILDCGHARLSKARLGYRFCDVNKLYASLSCWFMADNLRHVPIHVSEPHHSVVLAASVAVTMGSDYTERPEGLTATAIVEAVFDGKPAKSFSCVSGRERNAVSVRREGRAPAQLVAIDYDLVAMRDLIASMYAHLSTVATCKAIRLEWDDCDKTRVRFADIVHRKTQKGARPMPSFPDIDSHCRRVLWTINYMTNGMVGVGAFPSPFGIEHASPGMWGWALVDPSMVTGRGLKRRLGDDVDADRAIRRRADPAHHAVVPVSIPSQKHAHDGVLDVPRVMSIEYRTKRRKIRECISNKSFTSADDAAQWQSSA